MALPRVLVDNTFLRVYVLIALVLVLTGGLAVGGFLLVDRVRREHYHEQLATSPMALLTAQLAAQPEAERAAWLQRQGRELDIALELHALPSHPLSYFERARLEAGRTLVETGDEGGWVLHRMLPGEPRVLTARLSSLSEHQLLGLAGMLGRWLSEVQGEARRERLEQLQGSAIPLVLTETPPEDLEPGQLARLQDAEVVIRLLPQRWALSLYLRLPTETAGLEWVQVGPLNAFEPMPLSLSILLAVIILLGLAGAIYVIVRGVEARMARLELAATRIASGHLDTRVKVESGDFMGRLGMAFNGMAAQVQSLLRAQQEMIRAVSHELRTPVARIRFAVQMVEDMTDDQAVRRQLVGIDSDIEELDGLIDEILTYARLGGDQVQTMPMETEPVDCLAMARRVVEALSPLHGELRIELVADGEVEVEAEPRYLQRALQNLVANACSHARSVVRVTLAAEPRAVRLDVEDDGPGVPEAHRQAVFKPFARLDDSRTRRSGGYGLGLSIVHKIMAWHGGSAMVDDSPELGGARFTLLLPRRSPPRET
ncbi:ATP-binding protein [Halomonas sp. NO4]|uniref:ATP-binding protein n=1 Tax=Halomonas sp. NO4 TaxID=2484813 RepID=UPI0013D22520|nr:ATP-binding protein [Halomonas sp. NO4]